MATDKTGRAEGSYSPFPDCPAPRQLTALDHGYRMGPREAFGERAARHFDDGQFAGAAF
ncbi:hypothetical protein [Mycobacterium kyorinense]|uniref:hypothetical protein n=1 Tax=Mycobacterium kyorinense TaxID=487514 RepID=UPI000AEB909F|nr:hypothetical protein [Mycobacterium kyorinense]